MTSFSHRHGIREVSVARVTRLAVAVLVSLAPNCGGGQEGRQSSSLERLVPTWGRPADDTSWDPVTHLPTRIVHASSGVIMRLIPAGRASLGIKGTETVFEERPSHTVSFNRPFYLAECELTWQDFERTMGTTLAGALSRRPSQPVFAMSMRRIGEYCARHGLRLPTEDEWEYACRWGSEGLRYGPLDTIAVYALNSPADVHGKAPNPLGLFDMIGNVWGICEPASGVPADKIVLRGGGVNCTKEQELRATTRDHTSGPGAADGFRVACDP